MMCFENETNQIKHNARMVEVVDTEDSKSFANIRRGGSSPSASIIL